MTELRRRGGGGDPDSTENISDKVIYRAHAHSRGFISLSRLRMTFLAKQLASNQSDCFSLRRYYLHKNNLFKAILVVYMATFVLGDCPFNLFNL